MIWMLVCKVAELPSPGNGPFPEPSKEETGDFYVRLGMTIAAWQFVESSLFTIYQCAFDPQRLSGASMEALSAAFHQPPGFRTRLDMTNAAIQHSSFDPAIKDEWNKLYTRALKRSKRRNVLAHAIVCFQPYERLPGKQLFLSGGLTNAATRQLALDDANIITQKQLDEMRVSFQELANALSQFFGRLLAAMPPGHP